MNSSRQVLTGFRCSETVHSRHTRRLLFTDRLCAAAFAIENAWVTDGWCTFPCLVVTFGGEGCRGIPAAAWRLETGDWRLETGDWRLETGESSEEKQPVHQTGTLDSLRFSLRLSGFA